jgi:predicted nucleotidyltransferase
VARDEAGPDSDVDLLVEFARPVGMFRFLAVKEYLEALLGCPVDLGTRDALKRQFRDAILRGAIYVSHNESDKNPGLAIRNRGFSRMSIIDCKIEGSEGVC